MNVLMSTGNTEFIRFVSSNYEENEKFFLIRNLYFLTL